MAKLFRTLFRSASSSQPSSEISRYDLSWYIQQLNNPYALMGVGGSTQRYGRQVEDVENAFTGYVQQAYKANGPIFAIILARLLLFSEARFTFRRLINGRPGELYGGENGELSLLAKPWPNGTTGELLGRMEQDVSLGGNFYAVNEGDRLRRLRPDWVSIVLSGDPTTDTEVDVEGYAYSPGGYGRGEMKLYLADEVCHWSPIPDPEAMYRGMSWITPVVRELQADGAATDHKNAFFKNGAKPGLVVSLKESVREEQFKKFVRAMSESHNGADSAYKTLYLAGGAEVTVAGSDLRQLDFRATQGAGETRLCAAGGVPPIIVGLSEGLQAATYSNYASARRKFGDHWARPQWRSACAALATITEVPDGAELWYDDRDISFLREDQKDAAEIQSTRAGTINTYITAGFTAESAVAAVVNDDETQLVHSGMVSVQLQPPGGGVPEVDPALAAEPPLDEPATDEDTDALIGAMAELDSASRAWAANLHPRGKGGKFRSTQDRLRDSLSAHKAGGGGADPFEMFSREQLRRVAKARGVDVKNGAGKKDISAALLDGLHGGANPAGLQGGDGSKLHGVKKPAAKPAAAKPATAAQSAESKPEAPKGPASPQPEQADDEPGQAPTFRGEPGGIAAVLGSLADADEADVRAFLEAHTAIHDAESGMSLEIDDVQMSLNLATGERYGFQVEYVIRDRDGNVVGSATRMWRPPSGDQPAYVEHHRMELDPSAQGNGFASRWNAQMEDVYRANGMGEIRLHANIDVGGYAWARQGYTWQDEDDARYIGDSLQQALADGGPDGTWTEEHKAEFAELARRLAAGDPDLTPTPLEISMVGWRPGLRTWPGKEFMLGSDWQGVKTL